MKLVANIQLKPTQTQLVALKQMLKACNEACNYVSGVAFQTKTFGQFALHKLVYQIIKKQFRLNAQTAVRCIAKVAATYADRKKRISQHRFRSTAAQSYDDRIFRICNDNELSIWCLGGRQRVKYVCGERQRKLLKHRKGEVDLMFVRGKWYVACVCDIDTPPPRKCRDVLGVDLGIVNLAFDSDGESHSGTRIQQERRKYSHRRRNLQRKRTRSAKRKLKKISGRQARFQKNTNHCISKHIVEKAQRSGCGIAIEKLTHIRTRVKATRKQRSALHNWGFGQLRLFLEYKAQLYGVPILMVNPHNTSRECSRCGHIEKSNRLDQSTFSCKSCGFVASADYNAALIIRARATVNWPKVAAA